MDNKFKCALIFAAIVLIGIKQAASVPSVNTNVGPIEGITSKVLFNGIDYTVNTYLGIPYAKPPVGDLRFAKPVPAEIFKTHYKATSYGKVCPQNAVPGLPEYDTDKMSEDCLFLNIFVRNQKPDNPSGHAVMIWIHGGAFNIGSSTEYSANTLAAFGNVIVVSINYRLSILGFARSGDSNALGNVGLWDQHLAFKWVNENIRAFGGDNGRVTIFGESAGGISVGYQSLLPLNKGLFHRGIQQSGNAALTVCYREDVISQTKFLAERLNCSTDCSKDMITCMRSVDYETIMSTINKIMEEDPVENSEKVAFQPTLDNDFFKTSPYKIVRNAFNGNDVSKEVEFSRTIDIINGANSHEGACMVMLGWFTPEDDEEVKISREEMNSKHVPFGVSMLLGPNVPKEIIDIVIAEYTNWENPDDPIKLRDELVQSSSVHSNATNSNSYQYLFRPRPSNPFIPSTPSFVEGANHADEIGFVLGFDEEIVRTFEKLFGKELLPVQEWEKSLSTTVMTYWTNFVKSGNPNKPSPVSVEWPKYSPDSQRYMSFDKGPGGIIAKQYLSARRANFWLKVVPSVMEAINKAKDSPATVSKQAQDTCSKDGDCGDL